jgi:hypothetical protein
MGLFSKLAAKATGTDFRAQYDDGVARIDAQLVGLADFLDGTAWQNPHGTAGYAHGELGGHRWALYPVMSGVQRKAGLTTGARLDYYLELVVDDEVVWRRGAAMPVVTNPFVASHPKHPKVEHDVDYLLPEFEIDVVADAIHAACGIPVAR